MPHGEAAAHALLDADRPVTALVCVSDSLALGALQAGRGIPVIGFDDTPAARAVGLTSVSQPLAEAAARCVSLLIRALAGDGARARQAGKDVGGRTDEGDVERGSTATATPEAQPAHVLLQPSLVRRRSA